LFRSLSGSIEIASSYSIIPEPILGGKKY